ncbi:membrane primary amine oxidase-like [Ahaetulla prasina]|uniref:membrane primary amine oxidase-like n=1 Tax=Ahaetulla prasina TaxID=499056 RepID=UPI002648EDB4|nr:membrane primary amine oxidase-like [Ahaetulla prasina]
MTPPALRKFKELSKLQILSEPLINWMLVQNKVYIYVTLTYSLMVGKMNSKVIYSLIAICVTIIFILVLVFCIGEQKHTRCESSSQKKEQEEGGQDAGSQVFQDLTREEIMQVKRYLQSNLGVPLAETPQAKPSDNCIYSITLQLPPKAQVLQFLDHHGSQPPREALAVVHFGNQVEPNVTEYLVGPLPEPTYHEDITVEKYGRKLPYSQRMVLTNEFDEIRDFLKRNEYLKAPNFMQKVLNYNGSNLQYNYQLPLGLKSGDRKTWVSHFQNVTGFYLHPVGFEVQVDHSSLDVSKWKLIKVFYNGQYFEDMEELERQFNMGQVRVDKVKEAPLDGGYSSLKQRVPPKDPGPLQYEPRGPRYRIHNNHVTFLNWSFAFGIDASRGPRIFDVRFNGERIIYELSLQEATAIYGSNSPTLMLTRYLDASFGLGSHIFPLTQGVDCPYLSSYLDWHFFYDSSLPVSRKRSICIFEQNAELPIRRHFESVQSPFYGGLPDLNLIFRTISSVDNYDYVWDFIFHQNGAVGVRVHATGYIISDFYFGDAEDFGNRVQEKVLGTIHTHNIHFKVDLDIGGVENTLVGNDMAFETIQAPWSPKDEIHRLKMVREILDTENKAAFHLHDDMPKYLYFSSNCTNKWGHEQGYRIQIVSFPGDHLLESDPMEPGLSWGRYKLAVTKRKENEPFSTTAYNQVDPWNPPVAFADFINNENIVSEDLVAWINTGFLHIPHAEDIPTTATLGNVVGFFLRPYNYFDDDPSIYSPDSIYFHHKNFLSCEANQLACLAKLASCLPIFPLFTYEGFQNITL